MPTKQKVKKIELKNKTKFVLAIQYFITTNSNSKLISLAMNRACFKFAKELEEIPLSEELQNFNPKKA